MLFSFGCIQGKKGGPSREGSVNPQHLDIDPFLASGTARDAFEAAALAGAVASLNTVAAAALAAKVGRDGGWLHRAFRLCC